MLLTEEIGNAKLLRYAHNILLYEMQSTGESTKFDVIEV